MVHLFSRQVMAEAVGVILRGELVSGRAAGEVEQVSGQSAQEEQVEFMEVGVGVGVTPQESLAQVAPEAKASSYSPILQWRVLLRRLSSDLG